MIGLDLLHCPIMPSNALYFMAVLCISKTSLIKLDRKARHISIKLAAVEYQVEYKITLNKGTRGGWNRSHDKLTD